MANLLSDQVNLLIWRYKMRCGCKSLLSLIQTVCATMARYKM